MLVVDAEQLLRGYVDAGDGRDFHELERLLHVDVVTHSPGSVTIRGLDAQIGAWAAAHEGLSELRHEICEVIACGSLAAARMRVSGVHTGRFLGVDATGTHLEVDQALWVRANESQIVEMWEIVDTGSGLQQLGVLHDQSLGPGQNHERD